jgi:23S rRNA pseudouridine1911/1915/1917 synthase
MKSSDQRWIRHTVTAEEAGRTVEEVLTGTLEISRRMIQRLTRSKGIRLNGRAAFLARKVRAGDEVSARVASREETALAPVPMELAVVYEDADVLVVDKPPSLLVHPTSPSHRETLSHGVAHQFAERGLRARVRPVHRIDRDTSGLVLFAKSAFAHQHLDRQLREREVVREYLALVSGRVEGEGGEVDAPIGRHPRDPSLRAVSPETGEPALTRFRVVERFAGASLLELELETGRTHQIRVHLAYLGHPLLGDLQYGGPRVAGLRRQALHAHRLRFRQPTSGETVTCEAPLPPDLERVRRELGGS